MIYTNYHNIFYKKIIQQNDNPMTLKLDLNLGQNYFCIEIN